MNPRSSAWMFSVLGWGIGSNLYPFASSYTVPRFDSGVVIPDHSAQRIAAAQAKRERKAAKRAAEGRAA